MSTLDRSITLQTGGPLKVERGMALHMVENTSGRECSANNRGEMVRVRGAAGAVDTFAMCRKTAADTYAWVTVPAKTDTDLLYQPLDSDLTAIAALTTNAAGRSTLTLTDPNADTLVGWDDSAGSMINFTLGTGLSTSGTTLNVTPDVDLRFAQQSVAAGDTVANTVTPTAFTAAYTIPTASFVAGRVFRVTARGPMRNNATTPTFQMDLRLGTTIVGTISFTQASNNTLRGWVLNSTITVISTGASGSVECDGEFIWNQSAAGANVMIPMNPSATVTVDTTADRSLNLLVTWGAANANNTVTCRSLIVEALG